MATRRRFLLAAATPALLAGCGFQLRQAPVFAFQKIYVAGAPGSALVNDIKRGIGTGSNITVLADAAAAQVILDVLLDRREKVVVGINASGEVREFQLRTRLQFRLRTPQGKELIPATELVQQRDIGFTESTALAEEQGEQLLYRDMQAEIVQQLMRRLAAVKTIA
jgi:LPS-assembly lipoprotein